MPRILHILSDWKWTGPAEPTLNLCAALRECVRTTPTGTRVNLLFDHQMEAVRVDSPYGRTGAGLRLTPREAGPLFVRIPRWVRTGTLAVEPATAEPIRHGDWLVFPTSVPGRTIQIDFPLVEREIVLSEALHIRPIRVRLRGDEVTAMDDFGADLTFFPPLDPTGSRGDLVRGDGKSI